MIIGGDIAWKEFLFFRDRDWNMTDVVEHKLGILWLSAGESEVSPSEEIMPIVRSLNNNHWRASKVRLGKEDREQEIKELEKDLRYQSPIDDKITMSRTNEAVLKKYQDSVKLVTLDNGEHHLQFNLLWARNPIVMRDNYQQAKNVLVRLRRKLQNQPELSAKYCEKIETAIAEDHIVRIYDAELQDKENISKPHYYIPHFNTSQSKFRVVYDAARKHEGISLNSSLERGPFFMQSLRSILIRFGEKIHGIAGGVANMFFSNTNCT